jgi:hypothetical protein
MSTKNPHVVRGRRGRVSHKRFSKTVSTRRQRKPVYLGGSFATVKP